MLSSILVAILFFCLTLLPILLAIFISPNYLLLYIFSFIVFRITEHGAHSDDEIERWMEDEWEAEHKDL